jgi:hypothetical protein
MKLKLELVGLIFLHIFTIKMSVKSCVKDTIPNSIIKQTIIFDMFITRLITLPSVYSLTLTKASFEKIYRSEQDAKTKERMLLVLNVVYHGTVAAHM